MKGAATFTFSAKAGQTYQIAVDGVDGAAGDIRLAIRPSNLTKPPGGGNTGGNNDKDNNKDDDQAKKGNDQDKKAKAKRKKEKPSKK